MTTIQRKISLSIHCQLLKISGGESGPKKQRTEKDISRIGLKVFAEFWSPSSALWECQSFGWFTKGKSTFFPWRISTGISVKKEWGEDFCWKCFKELSDIHWGKIFFFNALSGGSMKRKSNEETKIFARIGLAGRMYKVSLLIHKKSVNWTTKSVT